MSRWEVALRVGVIVRKSEVVEFALTHYPGPIATPDKDGPQLATAIAEEPDAYRVLRDFHNLEGGPVYVAADGSDVPMLRILVNHGTTDRESRFALVGAIDNDAIDILRSHLRRDDMDPWVLQHTLHRAATSGQNALIKLLLKPGNRELIPQLFFGKGYALYMAARENDPSLVPDLVESDDDLDTALSLSVINESQVALGKLLQWIVTLNQTSRNSDPYVVLVEKSIRKFINYHPNAIDRDSLELIPLLCEHFSEAQAQALQEDSDVGTIVRTALMGVERVVE
ncbi:hypothetical protein HK097_007698 [Rhizophlyctis rosea]|uniref:Uncharacterized protein n=1 Tax=Rhizophlyctis rosea TaxID=64517 RepID=A0AAD5SIK5_9FUNG|nr:hypothetical protein HK097_007698 [Rhizophlyctis rosea]